MAQPRPTVTVPYKLSNKALIVSLLLLVLPLYLCLQFYISGESVFFPVCMTVLFAMPLLGALTQHGKTVFTFAPDFLESMLLPSELGSRIFYADIASVWLVQQQGVAYLCFALHHAAHVLAPLTPRDRKFFHDFSGQGRGDIFLAVSALSVEPEFLRDELRSRLLQSS